MGQGVQFITYLGLLYQPIVRLTQFYGGITATLAAVDRISELLDEPEPAARLGTRQKRIAAAMCECAEVSFRYRASGPLVLEGINLHVEPGRTIGIYGPSGSGKSTLLALLPRLYELPEGDGHICSTAATFARCIRPISAKRHARSAAAAAV